LNKRLGCCTFAAAPAMQLCLRYMVALAAATLLAACTAPQKAAAQPLEPMRPQAFPTAEGFGKYATGGRGGKVCIVTNLNNEGPGSFREAAEAKGKRIIVFEVSGTIRLQQKLSIKGDVTIAGQTAPGDGICIADQPVSLGGDNIIVRYLRFRLGDRYQNGGQEDGSGSDDAFGGTKRKNIIIDHCTMGWSTDEAFSVYAGDSTTLQWNLIAEPLNYSYHFETGDKDFERHGYGGIWGGAHLTAHHNLFAHCNNRCPRFNGIRTNTTELVDYCNNVVYNWQNNNIYAGEGGQYNLVNNYYKYGPDTKAPVRYQLVNPGHKLPEIPFGTYYVAGNHADGAPEVTANNWLGIRMGNDGTEADKAKAVVDRPHPAMPINLQTATEAYAAVLERVGASYRRDTLDKRIVNDVKNRTGRLIDVQGGHPHGTPFEQTVAAWPYLQSLPAPVDTDRDGLPDAWELAHKLNPNDANDARAFSLHPFYTNIEMYINSLTP
jgi:pectate lyase